MNKIDILDVYKARKDVKPLAIVAYVLSGIGITILISMFVMALLKVLCQK